MIHDKSFKENNSRIVQIGGKFSDKIKGPLLRAKRILEKMGIYYADATLIGKYDILHSFMNILHVSPLVITNALENPWFLSIGIQIAEDTVVDILTAFFEGGGEEIKKLLYKKGLYHYPESARILMGYFIHELEDEMDASNKKSIMEILPVLEKSNLMKISYLLSKATKKHQAGSKKCPEDNAIMCFKKAGLIILLIYFLYIMDWTMDAPFEIKKRVTLKILEHDRKGVSEDKEVEREARNVLKKDDYGWLNWSVYHFLSMFQDKEEHLSLMREFILELIKGEDTSKTPKVKIEDEVEKEIFMPLKNTFYRSGISPNFIDASIYKVFKGEGLKYNIGVKADNFDEGIAHIMEKLRANLSGVDIDKIRRIKDLIIKAIGEL